MTDTPRTSPPAAAATAAAAADRERPFTARPGRWVKERDRALRTGHIPGSTCTSACETVLVYERASWGWLAWTVPGDGSRPGIPHQIGVLAPDANCLQRWAVRWLTRRPARYAALADVPGSLRLSTAGVALVSLLAALIAAGRGVAPGVVVPAMLLVLALADHLPGRLDTRARAHVRTVEGDRACRYLRRQTALHTSLVQAAATTDAAGSRRHEQRRAVQIGRHLLWEASGLLHTRDPRAVSGELIARERLMLQLAHQAVQIVEHTADGHTPGTNQTPGPARPVRPHALGAQPPAHPRLRPVPALLPPKEVFPMPQPGQADSTLDVYLLFAHEPYYPAAAQEINTTVVVAASLLHPRVRQPDGARIHDRLVRGRRVGEIVPLATLTHELDGGTRWPEVGDWERVTEDLLQLVRGHDCDALNLGLPEIARALVCAGPRSEVRTLDPASGRQRVYGPADRVGVLVEVGRHLARAEAGSPLWPGEGLQSPAGFPEAL
ncbi:hypothetical protein [Streptomyces sp. NPDC088794]|uniref:hypothetical protein n=1 Tax=Streptomyces sp. NPDC088794 TaxID=3365902 RepID=UPI00381B7CCC